MLARKTKQWWKYEASDEPDSKLQYSLCLLFADTAMPDGVAKGASRSRDHSVTQGQHSSMQALWGRCRMGLFARNERDD